MSGLGPKLIQAVKEAIAGDFARVTVEGVTWVRKEELDHLREERSEMIADITELRDAMINLDSWLRSGFAPQSQENATKRSCAILGKTIHWTRTAEQNQGEGG